MNGIDFRWREAKISAECKVEEESRVEFNDGDGDGDGGEDGDLDEDGDDHPSASTCPVNPVIAIFASFNESYQKLKAASTNPEDVDLFVAFEHEPTSSDIRLAVWNRVAGRTSLGF